METPKGKTSVVKSVAIAATCLVFAVWMFFFIQGLIPHHEMAHRAICVYNLKIIENAKQAWVLEHRNQSGIAVSPEDLSVLFKTNKIPKCPDGGTYTIGRVGENPTCSIPGHILPTP